MIPVIWIPVTDRLPAHRNPVHIQSTEWRIPGGYCTGYYNGEYWFSYMYGIVNGVTHWAEMESSNG